ncbi:MAG TPA: H-X9-DG-CTERM domain-containing protein, partial [Planctomycetota bacterium]|nr:H-X9-DG-CTERM domain-containing protein [Planctomycetota bacterium]
GLGRAQKQARTIQCNNNMRMIGSAIIGYANKTGGGFFPNFGLRDQLVILKPELGPTTDIRVSDTWVWELDFIAPEDRYFSVQEEDHILPPRMAPPVLRCPADVQLYINGQSVLTSYWLHPYLSFTPYSTITKRSISPLGFEADALNESDPRNCGCRFHRGFPPTYIDTTHFGGSHILFCDGSVRLFTPPPNLKNLSAWTEGKISYWETQAGYTPCPSIGSR